MKGYGDNYFRTLTLIEDFLPLKVFTVIVAVPGVFAVTLPFFPTFATLGLLEVYFR